MTLLKRIDNIDILTRDVDCLVRFYNGVLGFPFHLPYVAEENWASINVGNVTLFLFEGLVGDHAPRRTPINADNAPGLDCLAWEVDDLDQAIAELDGNVEWAAAEPIEWVHGSGASYRYRPFYDPDGNLLYITQPTRA
jgi:catechol 2,3-dioxygenase-like lactoylglutathione lyase family enzyme